RCRVHFSCWGVARVGRGRNASPSNLTIMRTPLHIAALSIAFSAIAFAQTVRPGRRPPAPPRGPPSAEAGSAAPDGYAPIPEWLGQTRAPHPAKTAAFTVETVAEGFTGAFCFSFLPDGRLLVGERPGKIKI